MHLYFVKVFPRSKGTGLDCVIQDILMTLGNELSATKVRKIWFYKSVMIYLNVKKPDL